MLQCSHVLKAIKQKQQQVASGRITLTKMFRKATLILYCTCYQFYSTFMKIELCSHSDYTLRIKNGYCEFHLEMEILTII